MSLLCDLAFISSRKLPCLLISRISEQDIFTQSTTLLEGSRGEAIPYQFYVGSNTMGTLDKIKRNRYNDNRENPGPPTMLELWNFALGHYLDLGFMPGMF